MALLLVLHYVYIEDAVQYFRPITYILWEHIHLVEPGSLSDKALGYWLDGPCSILSSRGVEIFFTHSYSDHGRLAR